MIPQEKSKGHKWTNIVLIAITLAIIVYVGYTKGRAYFGLGKNVALQASGELLTLDEKERPFIGVNEKQIFKVTTDGIKAYQFDQSEIWSDTFSMANFDVKQKAPYIAIAGKKGKTIAVYNTKGKQCQIEVNGSIVKFSVNEIGGVAVIEENGSSYVVSAYDRTGKRLCQRVSYVSSDGYPTAAVLSPDNKLLLMSCVSVDNPQVDSSILAIKIGGTSDEQQEEFYFGYIEENNLVYHLEYINKETWACIGDKAITWYNNEGEIKGKQDNLALVFRPELIKTSKFGTGYLPIVYSERPTQNVVHRQDQLNYFDDAGKITYQLSLEGGVENYYADENGIILKVNGIFRGYNKLCNQIFEYTPNIEVDKVIYIPAMQKGIAVCKDKVVLLTPKKEKQ